MKELSIMSQAFRFKSGTVPIFAGTAAQRWSAKKGLSPFAAVPKSGLLAAFLALAVLGSIAHADEGMWLFNYPPTKLLEGAVRLRADRRRG